MINKKREYMKQHSTQRNIQVEFIFVVLQQMVLVKQKNDFDEIKLINIYN